MAKKPIRPRPKIKATDNKAENVEKKQKIEKLWAQYGRCQAEREQLSALTQQRTQQMRNLQNQIEKLEQG